MAELTTERNKSLGEKIILGSVQFGKNYGISNVDGVPSDKELKGILDLAFEEGVKTIDCAEAYGNALDRIAQYHVQSGNRFNIISKLKSLPNLNLAIEKVVAVLDKMDIPAFEAILLHDVVGYLNNYHVIETLSEVKKKGLIKKIGVSIYTNEQLEFAIADKNVDIIQLPFNLLDNMSIRGELMTQAKDAGKTIHVRSVFLQGLFFRDIESLPLFFQNLAPELLQIAEIAAEYRMPIRTLALVYTLQNPLIDGVIIGVDSVSQLRENVIASSTSLQKECVNRINSIKVANPVLLNPSTWK